MDCVSARRRNQMAEALKTEYGKNINTYRQIAEWNGRSEKDFRENSMMRKSTSERSATNKNTINPHKYAILSDAVVAYSVLHVVWPVLACA